MTRATRQTDTVAWATAADDADYWQLSELDRFCYLNRIITYQLKQAHSYIELARRQAYPARRRVQILGWTAIGLAAYSLVARFLVEALR